MAVQKTLLMVLVAGFIGNNCTSALAQQSKTADEAAWSARDVWKLSIDGNETFTDREIQRALSLDPQTQLLIGLDTPLDKLASMVRARISKGYKNAGFANVTIDTRIGKTLQATITEGTRFQNGDVNVVNATSISAQQLSAFLTQSQPKDPAARVISRTPSGRPVIVAAGAETKTSFQSEGQEPVELDSPLWEREKFTSFSKSRHDELRAAIQSGLERQGFFDTRFSVEILTNSKSSRPSSTLQITIENEGPQTKIGAIEYSGLKLHKPDQVSDWLQLEPGKVFTDSLRDRIVSQLINSGRFLTANAWADAPIAPGAPQTLHIDVREYDRVVPLGQKLSPRQQTMLRFADWLANWKTSTTDFVVRLEYEADSAAAQQKVSAISGSRNPQTQPQRFVVDAGISSQKGCDIHLSAFDSKERACLDHSILLTNSAVGFLAWQDKQSWIQDQVSFGILQSIAWTGVPPNEAGRRFAMNISAGVNSKPVAGNPVSAHLVVNPAAALELVHWENKATISEVGETLVLKWDNEKRNSILKVHSESGALLEFTSSGNPQLSIKTKQNAVEERIAALELRNWKNSKQDKKPVASLVSYVAKEGTRYFSAVENKPLQLLLRTMESPAVLARLDQINFDTNKFVIPADSPVPPPNFTDKHFLAMLAAKAVLPAGSISHQLVHSVEMSRQGNNKPLTDLIQRIALDESVGPLQCLFAGWAVPSARSVLAKAGLKRVSPQGLQNDLQAIFSRPGVAQDVAVRGLEILQNLTDEETELLVDWWETVFDNTDKMDIAVLLQSIRGVDFNGEFKIADFEKIPGANELQSVVESKLREFAGPAVSGTKARLTSAHKDVSKVLSPPTRPDLSLDDDVLNSPLFRKDGKANSKDRSTEIELPDNFEYEGVRPFQKKQRNKARSKKSLF